MDKNQDADNPQSKSDFPPLDVKPSIESSTGRVETPESRQVDQKDKPSGHVKPTSAKSEKPTNRPPSFLIKALRWFLVLLIVFGLGAFTVIYFNLLPLQQNYRSVNQELQNAQQRIDEAQSQGQQTQDDMQAEIDRLKTFESQNEKLQTQLGQSELHVAILSAQNDVINAQLALEKEDTNSANLALSQTPQTLDTISNLLPPNQREVVTSMKDRLDLAANGIDVNAYAALSDLDVLYNDLIKLENTFFSQP